jgi:hypothetical protein
MAARRALAKSSSSLLSLFSTGFACSSGGGHGAGADAGIVAAAGVEEVLVGAGAEAGMVAGFAAAAGGGGGAAAGC